ncbi:MAG: response regulator [Treponema sp.]|jgi:CheY-like chemotaxis protein|nr:response regulator [Treponema sp.]
MGELKTILAIDDSVMELAVFRNILRKEYEVLTAESAPEALELLNAEPVDLILLDIEMPGPSGFELLHQIRKIPALMETPVLVVTAHSSDDFVGHAMSEGAKGLIAKPVNPKILKENIAAILAQ